MSTLFTQNPRAHITVEVDQTVAMQIKQLKKVYQDRGERFSITALIEQAVAKAVEEEQKAEAEGTMFM